MINIGEPFENKKFYLEILTPTHVGSSSTNHWQEGIDFLVESDITWLFDLRKLTQIINIDKLSKALTKEDESVTIKSLLEHTPLSAVAIARNFSTKSTEIKRHSFCGADGSPYIPGSSLKGAISSILIQYFSKKIKLEKSKDPRINVLGDFENSFMRFFQFPDVAFSETKFINTKVFNLQNNNGSSWEGGWKHGYDNPKKNYLGTSQKFNESAFVTAYEVVEGKSKIAQMSFKSKALIQYNSLSKAEKSKQKKLKEHTSELQEKPLDKLCKIVNDYTVRFLDKEIKFFEKYAFDENTKNALKNFKDLRTQVLALNNNDNICIFRLAAGSGFHNITGDWQFDDYINTGEWTELEAKAKLCKYNQIGKRKYKSRKLAFEKSADSSYKFFPMGFVKLTFES